MTGAECLLRTLAQGGVDVCFMNPGTSEMQFVSALDRFAGMRAVLCLAETVCAGAADGYARMTGRAASTLLHLGPGLANGLSNFHNARKARSPIVNVVGEHATAHLRYDAPLTADVEAFARPVSGWVRTLAAAGEMGAVAAEAVAASYGPPGQVASLIVPADFSWSEAGAVGARVAPRPRRAACAFEVPARGGAFFVGGAAAASEEALRAARAGGLPVFLNRYAARVSRGRPFAFARRVAYFPEAAEEMLAGLERLLLVEAGEPVSFFGYPGRRSTVAPISCAAVRVVSEEEDGVAALCGLERRCALPAEPARALMPGGDGALTPALVGAVLAALLPEGAVVSDEMVSSGEPVNAALDAAAPHVLLPVTGGSIGQGLPVALGAAVACPDRKVVALEADGSAMYSLQALWTMARERADVLVVIFANRRYRILEVEMARTGSGAVGPRAAEMMDIGRPDLDWVRLAEGMGVEASRAETVRGFAAQLEDAFKRRGPRLIEAVI